MIELRNIEKAFGEKQLFNGYNAAIPEASLTIICGLFVSEFCLDGK